jgi:heme O synthase-like polyprenyltransferase
MAESLYYNEQQQPTTDIAHVVTIRQPHTANNDRTSKASSIYLLPTPAVQLLYVPAAIGSIYLAVKTMLSTVRLTFGVKLTFVKLTKMPRDACRQPGGGLSFELTEDQNAYPTFLFYTPANFVAW